MWNKKDEYWNHFVERFFVEKIGGGFGITGPKLRKIKPTIFDDGAFWQDVFIRHKGMDNTPEGLAMDDPETYAHCLGNFWGMVCQSLAEKGLMK